jgi:hypothetical protein
MENREQQTEQLLKGIYRLCAGREDCTGCPFYDAKCVFEEPKPRTWFEEESAKVQEAPAAPAAPASAAEQPAVKEDAVGTWLVSTTMGSVLTKYVYICSKCGYRKESYLSIAPTTFCPECEKNKLAE